jgi:thiol-disulfide isomerase/thioredoxin
VYDFVLRKLDDSPLALASTKGKVVVLSFWATWCSPCQILEPILGDMSQKYAKNTDVAFLGVNSDEDESLVPRFLSRMRWELPVAYSNGLKEFLRVDAFPTVIIPDRDGKTIFRVPGFPETGYIDALTTAVEKTISSSKNISPK